VTGLVVLWCIASFWFPYGWDQGMFASMGDVIVRGGMPYRDGWELRGPLAFYVFALGEWLFGRHMWSVHVFDLPLLVAASIAVGSLVARITSRRTGYWAGLTLILWFASLTWFHMVEPDLWTSLLFALALIPLFESGASLRRLVISGFIVGCTAVIKPFNIVLLAVPLFYLFQERRTRKAWIIQGATIIGAAAAPALGALAWFAFKGAFKELIEVHLLYNFRVYGRVQHPGIRAELRGMARFFLARPLLFAFPVILIGIYSLWRKRRNAAVIVLAWTSLALLCVAVQGKFFVYHWALLFPPLTILGSIGFDAVRRPWRDRKQLDLPWFFRTAALVLALAGVLQLALASASSIALWAKFITGRIDSRQYYSAHRVDTRWVAADEMDAAAYIRARTSASEGMVVFGDDTLLNFLSGRANPTRFLTGGALTLGGPGSPRDVYRREYMGGLQKTPPAYLIVGKPYGAPGKERALRDFPELAAFLRHSYSLEAQFGNLDLYRLNRAAAHANAEKQTKLVEPELGPKKLEQPHQ